MRIIQTIDNKDEALMAGAFLLTAGIDCRVEEARESVWEVWIPDEDKLELAKEKLAEFMAEPDKSKYYGALENARLITEKLRREQEDAAKRQVDMSKRYMALSGPAPVTAFIITVCVALWGLEVINPNYIALFEKWLFINDPMVPGFLASVKEGQIWRLVTPIFLHAPLRGGAGLMGILHILFNMLWLKDLGPIVERRESSIKLVILVLVTAICSNLVQYRVSGPLFLGFSGVVYGLLGYLWMRGKHDREYGLRLNPGIVWFMLIWLVFGFVAASGFANYAHLFGLISGGVWGYLNSKIKHIL